MKVFKELTIVTPNKPGKLAQALRAQAQAGVNLIAIDGESNWMEGVLLLAVYSILGLAFYALHP